VQKSKLIERLAEVIQTKKVPILADVRDESPRMSASCWNPVRAMSTPKC
jgi:DNA gyrase/topoisomerase IV subunit A